MRVRTHIVRKIQALVARLQIHAATSTNASPKLLVMECAKSRAIRIFRALVLSVPPVLPCHPYPHAIPVPSCHYSKIFSIIMNKLWLKNLETS